MRSIIDSTDVFEAWMRKRTDVSRKLLKKKHRRMCEGPFPFLRATFYRWLIRQLAPGIAEIDMPKNPDDRRLVLAPHLLRLMGHETANIHLGSRSRRDLEARLNGLNRDGEWFSTATERMVACTRKDHAEWTSQFHES